ncbi:testis-expressed protein 43-like [Branchiostoma floridae]|uniref:Testis-expressed protein 43-like n=1 Tax=Branchiostoma floridae TaxID=7739 RepID=A0A9J7LF56_BRAFL|nr:testis-expressed protein 43-like [Branchiostoma floridae]
MADGGPPRSSVTPKVALQYSEMSKTPGNFQHIPKWSDLHPTIPQLYVPEWKTDMKNREVILRECKQAGLYYGPHDESLFLCKRERLNHGEDRRRVETNYASQPDRRTLINPPRWSHLYRHRSTLMMFTDPGSD